MDWLQRYYRNLLHDYRRYLRAVIGKADAESIHELRVLIKKLRAILHFFAFVDSGFDAPAEFEPYAAIFKAAGKIRDLDITLAAVSRIEKDHKLPYNNIRRLLRTERRSSAVNLRNVAGHLLTAKKIHDAGENMIMSRSTKKEAEDFLNHTESVIRSEIQGRKTDKRLHNIRKLSKDYLYVSKAAKLEAKNLKFIDELQKHIGDWHDLLIAVRVIEDVEKDRWNGLLEQLKKEERKLKKNIIQLLKYY